MLEAPPNSTGFVLLEELKILEHFDLGGMGCCPPTRCTSMVEAKKLAFADRERWGADPRTVEAPFERLLSAEYAAALAARIDMRQAAPTESGRTRPATRPISAPPTATATRSPASRASTAALAPASSPAIPAFCSTTAWPTGTSNPAIRTGCRPGRRVRHTMNPPLVLKDGALWCVFGTPGADNQVQVNLQVLTAMIDFGLDPQQAAEMPRWTSNVSGPVRQLAA